MEIEFNLANGLFYSFVTFMIDERPDPTSFTHRLVLGDMEMAYNSLLTEADRQTIKLVSDNPFSHVTYTHHHSEVVICFDIGALTEIANTKSNLIGVGY